MRKVRGGPGKEGVRPKQKSLHSSKNRMQSKIIIRMHEELSLKCLNLRAAD